VDASGRQARAPVFDGPNILWYLGALGATVASLDVVGNVDGGARGLWVLLVALAFLAGYGLISIRLLGAGWVIPGSVIAVWGISFLLVAGGAFERLIGVWPSPSAGGGVSVSIGGVAAPSPGPFESFEGHVFVLGLLAIAGGVAVYVLTRYEFAFVSVAGGTLFSAELVLPAIVHRPSASDHATALIVFGLAFLAAGILLDLRGLRRHAFWFHLTGLLALTGGLVYHAASNSSWGWELILVAGLLVLALAAPLRRATWVLFGILGGYAPLAHYAADWFGNTGTAAALAVVGFGIVAAGIAFRAGESGWDGLQVGRPAPGQPPMPTPEPPDTPFEEQPEQPAPEQEAATRTLPAVEEDAEPAEPAGQGTAGEPADDEAEAEAEPHDAAAEEPPAPPAG
jgi:hypothetical protein